jgi:hypothetical protein
MAKFSQTFLQGLLQPTYQQGLFTAAQQAAQLPGQLRQQQAAQEEMQRLRGMGAVERADFMAARAQTPQQLMAAEAAKGKAVEASALESLRGLEAARQAAPTDAEKEHIEGIMARVAVQAGVDPSTVTGRTQRESDDQVRRELNENRLRDEERAAQEKAIAQAYYAVPENVRAKFEENVIQSGFGNVIDELKEDKARDNLFNLQLQNAKTKAAEDAAMKKAPLPTTTLEDRINQSNIDPELKDQFLSELADIKQPDFEAGETWNPGERKLAENALSSLNQAVRLEVSREVSRKSQIRTDIRRLEKELTEGPNFREIQEYEAEAKDNLDTSWFSDPSEEEITAEATRLAAKAKRDRVESLLEQRYDELGETVKKPATEVEEETQEIGGYKVKEIK